MTTQKPKVYRKTKHSDFSSIGIKRPLFVSEIDLFDMKFYQLGLIDFLLYEPPKLRCGILTDNDKTNKILAEIQRVDKWLKKRWSEFILDNNKLLSELKTA